MKRKEFLAALVAGIAAPVLGKVKPKPKFPRYFAPRDWRHPTYCYVRADGPRCVVGIRRHGESQPTPMTLEGLLWRTDGPIYQTWREITAAEAEALLKKGFRR